MARISAKKRNRIGDMLAGCVKPQLLNRSGRPPVLLQLFAHACLAGQRIHLIFQLSLHRGFRIAGTESQW